MNGITLTDARPGRRHRMRRLLVGLAVVVAVSTIAVLVANRSSSQRISAVWEKEVDRGLVIWGWSDDSERIVVFRPQLPNVSVPRQADVEVTPDAEPANVGHVLFRSRSVRLADGSRVFVDGGYGRIVQIDADGRRREFAMPVGVLTDFTADLPEVPKSKRSHVPVAKEIESGTFPLDASQILVHDGAVIALLSYTSGGLTQPARVLFDSLTEQTQIERIDRDLEAIHLSPSGRMAVACRVVSGVNEIVAIDFDAHT